MKKPRKTYPRPYGTKETRFEEYIQNIPDGYDPVVEITMDRTDRTRIYDGVARKFIDAYIIRKRVFANTKEAEAWVVACRAVHKTTKEIKKPIFMGMAPKSKGVDLASLMGNMVKAQHMTNYLLRKLLAKECVGIPPEPTEMEDLKQGCLEQGYLDFCARVSNETQT
jgi:hypothetical protein